MDEENFWEEYGEFGTLRTSRVTDTDDGVDAAIDWIAPDGTTGARDTRPGRCAAAAVDDATHRIDWTERLSVPGRRVLDRTPFTTWGGYGGLTLRGAPTWTDTVLRLDDGTEPRTSARRAVALARDRRHRGRRGRRAAPAGVVILDHPDNPRFPTPWYASTRADTYGEGWANFVNAAFLWDEPMTIGPAPLDAAVPRVGARRPVVDSTESRASTTMGVLIDDSRALADGLLGFTVEAVGALARAHFPGWRIPHTFAGHPVDADVRADLLFTLTHLAHGGVREVADVPIDALVTEQLGQVDGRNTHTFFSYRIAETLLRAGGFDGNPLLASCSDEQREEVARAVDSRDWIELAHRRRPAAQLRRRAVALRARTAPSSGSPTTASSLEDLVGRLAALLTENPDGYLDDSNDAVRPLRHLHGRPLAVLRAARAAHRTPVARRHAHRARTRRHGRGS